MGEMGLIKHRALYRNIIRILSSIIIYQTPSTTLQLHDSYQYVAYFDVPFTTLANSFAIVLSVCCDGCSSSYHRK
jgi:hypothetical protein